MSNFNNDIQNVIHFYAKYQRFPFYFTDNQYEKSLNNSMRDIVLTIQNGELQFDPVGDIAHIYYNFNFEYEFQTHYTSICDLIENGIGLDRYEQLYPQYLQDFIVYIHNKRYSLDLKKYIQIEQLPLWKWDVNNILTFIDKLYYFTKLKNRLPIVYSFDVEEYELANFVNVVHYLYICDKLELQYIEELNQIKLFSFEDYKNSGYSYLRRYCEVRNVYYYDNEFCDFHSNFCKIFAFYREHKRLPRIHDGEYTNCVNIRTLYYANLLTKLETNVMKEFDDWTWSHTVQITDKLSTEKPMFSDKFYNDINQMLKNTYKVNIRRDYNYDRQHLRVTPVLPFYKGRERVAKKKCNLRLRLIREFERNDNFDCKLKK